MKVSTRGTTASIVRRFMITEDNPVIDVAYSNPPKKAVVDWGTIEYTLTDGRWTVRAYWAVDVYGDVLKKDGTRSENTHRRNARPTPDGLHSPELVLHEDWAWLQKIIDILRPKSDLSMITLRGHEVA